MTVPHLVEPGRLCWFIDRSSPSSAPLAFIRDHRGGAYVVGGPTGSHYTGHAESWWDKLSLIASSGYIPVELAMQKKIIPPDWAAPSMADKEAQLVERIRSGEG